MRHVPLLRRLECPAVFISASSKPYFPFPLGIRLIRSTPTSSVRTRFASVACSARPRVDVCEEDSVARLLRSTDPERKDLCFQNCSVYCWQSDIQCENDEDGVVMGKNLLYA